VIASVHQEAGRRGRGRLRRRRGSVTPPASSRCRSAGSARSQKKVPGETLAALDHGTDPIGRGGRQEVGGRRAPVPNRTIGIARVVREAEVVTRRHPVEAS
jgi:hypothetical protein